VNPVGSFRKDKVRLLTYFQTLYQAMSQ